MSPADDHDAAAMPADIHTLQTIDGHTFNPSDDLWTVATPLGPASFNFNNLPGASPRCVSKSRTSAVRC